MILSIFSGAKSKNRYGTMVHWYIIDFRAYTFLNLYKLTFKIN